jgi:Phosphotransferase enzyme family
VKAERFPADPAFPHLEIAGDNELMRKVFQQHLPALDDEIYHIKECRLSRVRYRRRSRCVLQYTLRIAESASGYEQIQWVTGVMYAGDVTRRKWEELQLLDSGRIPEVFSTFEPIFFIPDLGMLVEVFPYDRRLPSLPTIMAGPLPELEPLLLNRFGPGNWQTEAWNVEPVRHRAELGATLRLTVQAREDATGRMEERRFYAKVYHDDGGERTYKALRAMWERTGGGEEFTVGRPVAYLDDLRTLLQEEILGTPLRDILLSGEDATPAVKKAAVALAAMHLDRVPAPRYHRPQNEVAVLERIGRLLQWACPHLGAEVEQTVSTAVEGLQDAPTAPTHRDLKLDHILLDGDRPGLIDLDGFAEADPILDVASVLAHLTAMPFRFPHLREDRWQAAMRTFAEEYFAHAPRTWRYRLPANRAGALLKVAAGFFRRQESHWPDKIATLVGEASACLADASDYP